MMAAGDVHQPNLTGRCATDSWIGLPLVAVDNIIQIC